MLLLGNPYITLDYQALFWGMEVTPISVFGLSNGNTVGPTFVSNLETVLMNAASHYVLMY